MIKALLALALVLPVPAQYDTVPSLDWMDAPYTFVEDPCGVLAETAPEVAEWCEGAEVMDGSLDRQIANGSFRFWLHDGKMWQNSYVGSFGYSYFDDAILQSARVTMQLVCVDTVTGEIERNGAPYTVIANKEDPQVETLEGGVVARNNGGPVALSSDGPCRVGWNREVMVVAVMSDAPAVGWKPGDQSERLKTAGWVEGDNRMFAGDGKDTGITAHVIYAPTYGFNGPYHIRFYANPNWNTSGTRQQFCDSFVHHQGASSQLSAFNTLGGNHASLGINVGSCSFWWPVGADGPREYLDYSGTLSAGFGGFRNQERSGLPVNVGVQRGQWYPVGWPGGRFEPSGVVYVSGTLTRYGPVEELQWLPQEQPLTIFDVDGVCEEVGTCIARCDAPGMTWNPLEWWNDLREYLTCLVVPTVDLREFTESARTDLENSLAMQSIEFGVDRMQNLIAIPGFVAKPCGKLLEVSAIPGQTQAFSTCDISPEVRGHISAAVVIIFTGAALFTVMRLLFWAFGWETPSVFRSTDRDDD